MSHTSPSARASSATAHVLELLLLDIWLVILHFHLILFVRHAPKVASRRLYHLVVLHRSFEVLHLELPSEEHTLVALAGRLKLIFVSMTSAFMGA